MINNCFFLGVIVVVVFHIVWTHAKVKTTIAQTVKHIWVPTKTNCD